MYQIQILKGEIEIPDVQIEEYTQGNVMCTKYSVRMLCKTDEHVKFCFFYPLF